MNRRLGDLLVVSDMDGTLLTPEKQILPCDIETIRLFTSLGGHFTVATGRTVNSVGMYPELVPLVAPAIVSGGCVIFDYAEAALVRSAVMPKTAAREAMRELLGAFPALGAMVMGGDLQLYQAAPSAELDILINDERMIYFCRPEEDLPELWNKVLFAGPPQLLAQVQAYAENTDYAGIYFVPTAPIYYEMMPQGVTKGSALAELAGTLGIPMANTIVIGDYYNDIDMMREAGYAVAMGDAPAEVKAIADEVTGTSAQGGVGQFLYRLIQQYEG